MSCRFSFHAAFSTVLLLAASAPLGAQEKAPPPLDRESRFVEGLRERGYFDLALEYLESLRNDPATSAEFKKLIDFEQGRCLLDEAGTNPDPERRAATLEQARVKLDGFAKASPDHPRATEALVQLGRLYIERGHTAMILATEAKTPAETNNRKSEARAAFASAREVYARSQPPLKQAYEVYPKYLDPDDPRREARDRAHIALMDAELQMAIVDYEDAQTYALGSAERNKLLDRALAAFEGLYRRYREQMAGLHARMLQGKCFEEKGELGPAMGIYNELMDHPHPRLSDLQRFVAYYRIIVSYKRKEFALATDDALRWLQAYSRFRVTEEGLGVQLYLAKSLLAQLEAMPENDRESATRRAVEAVSEVSKYYSPHKAEALELLAKYKPKSALNLNQIANLVYDDAMNQARQAIDGQDWDRALALLRQAVLKADPRRDAEKANRARYYMAYTYLQSGRPYPAAALAEHIARRYPEGGLAAKAAEIGLVAHTQAYNTYSSHDRVSDLERLISLADYIVATWPDTVEGDTARATLGEIHIGRGHYEEAAKAFEGVRANSPRRLDAEVKAGDAHWRASQRLRDAGKNDEAEAESKRALELVQAALEARKKALTPPTDPSWIKNVNALAEIHRASGRPKDALGLLEPLAQTLQNASAGATAEIAPLREAVLILLTQTHLLDGQHERAIADMKALENLGADKAKLTQLYYQLSRRLQDEMKALDARNDRIGYQRMSQAYRQFLQALVGSEAGQSFDSLAFAGDALLTLSAAAEAEKVFDKILSAYENDAEFLKQPQADARILRVRLAKARSVREQSHFDEAHKLIVALAEQNPRLLEAQLELGLVLEDQARAENARNRWEVSYNHWRKLSEALARARPRRPEYYDAVYHVAEAQNGMGDRTRAVKTLKGAMALSPTLGSPENKAKYDALLARLGGS